MVDKVIMRSLKTDPSARFQNAAEMREALEAALREPELQRKRRRRNGLVAVGALMSALVAGAVTVGKDPALAERASAKVAPMVNYVRELRQGKPAESAHAANDLSSLAKAAPAAPKSAPLDAAAAEPSDPELALAEETDETGEPEVDIDLDAPEAAGEASATAETELADASDTDAADDTAAEEPIAEASPAAAAAGTAPADVEAAPGGADLEAQLVQAEQQMTEGNRLKGFNAIKRLAWKHPKDARALRAYSEAAVSMKAWGEAYRAAYNWAEVDASPDAKLQLAKLERATSRGNYKNTLKKLLAQHPDHPEALALMGGASNKALAQRDE